MSLTEHRLRDELEEARDQIYRLKKEGGALFIAPLSLHLTRGESAVLGVLMLRRVASTESIALLAEVSAGSVGVMVRNIRRRLKPLDIKIGSRWGFGYYLDEGDKAKIKNLSS